MAWYRAGTASVTNGSDTVIGVGTSWGILNPGDIFFLNSNKSNFYEIESVTNDATIVLTENYVGSTLSAQSYSVIQHFTNTDSAGLLMQMSDLLQRMASRDAQMIAWATGVSNGGPNNNGYYPITTGVTEYLVPCPALIDPQSGGGGGSAVERALFPISNIGSQSTSLTIDLSLGQIFTATIGGSNMSLALTNWHAGSQAQWFRLVLKQGVGGAAKITTWPGNVFFPNNVVPVLSTMPDMTDTLDFVSLNGGGTWMCFLSGSGFSL
jgi:hypothetical protein